MKVDGRQATDEAVPVVRRSREQLHELLREPVKDPVSLLGRRGVAALATQAAVAGLRAAAHLAWSLARRLE